MTHEKRPQKPPKGRRARRGAAAGGAILLAVLLAGLYLFYSRGRYQNMFASEAIKLSESLEILLPAGHISDLAEDMGASDSPEYVIIRKKLIELVEKTGLVYYAFLIGEKDGSAVLLADSRPAPLSVYSPLDGFYEGIPDSGWVPFEAENSILTKPFHNRWGSWIRALVPVKNPADGTVCAILGLSYSAADWRANVQRRMAPDIAVSFSLFVLLLSFLWILFKHIDLKEKSRQLAFDEQLYRSLFEKAPIGVTLNDYRAGISGSAFISANPAAKQILGLESDRHLNSTSWMEMTERDSLSEELLLFERFINRETDGYSFEKPIIRPDGSRTWVNIKVSSFIGSTDSDFIYLCLIEDISARRSMEATLRESERSKSVLLSHLPGMAYRCANDEGRTMEFVSEGCRSLTGYPPESIICSRDISYGDIVSPEYRQLLREKCTRAVEQRKSFHYEYEIVAKSGERKWVLEMGQGIYGSGGRAEALEGIILDISEQKKRDAQITFLNERDFLTGLYNRNYLEREKERLGSPEHSPLAVAICDINGLRMINDAYGQTQGDRLIMEAAKLLQNAVRPADVLGRVSGGEFMLLMPNTGSEEAEALVKEIQSLIDSYNRTRQAPLYEISLTIGYSAQTGCKNSVENTVKAAEGNLKKRKLLNQKSLHHSILSSIMATLYAKSQETEVHGQRLGQYAAMLGEELGLEQKDLDDLRLLSMLHDIGKIGIDDRILNKPGKLTPGEWEQMKKHPEIGHRIAMSTPELEHVAEYILRHHERWDGKGYPGGVRGPGIPLLSRILAVADAYDAMTEDRIYQEAMPPEAALVEIVRCAGTQFDPDIAALFARKMENGPG